MCKEWSPIKIKTKNLHTLLDKPLKSLKMAKKSLNFEFANEVMIAESKLRLFYLSYVLPTPFLCVSYMQHNFITRLDCILVRQF